MSKRRKIVPEYFETYVSRSPVHDIRETSKLLYLTVFLVIANVTLLMKFGVLTSLLMSRVSCVSLWAIQYFQAPLKIEQTLSHRQENVG